MNLRLVAVLIAVALALAAVPCNGAAAPADTVAHFYRVYLELRPNGAPSMEQQKAMAPYLSQRLLKLLEQARRAREDFIRRYPDKKPPWADGCLFASLFEGPKRFRVSGVTRQADATFKVKVHFWYEEGTAGWEDAAIVRKEAGRFVIDDVLLSGAGPFNPPGRLSESLQSVEKQGVQQ